MNLKTFTIGSLALFSVLALSGCGEPSPVTSTTQTDDSVQTRTKDTNFSSTQIANPASVFCVEQGGTLEIREERDGQVGYCLLPDGQECEEWTFFRGECPIKNTNQE